MKKLSVLVISMFMFASFSAVAADKAAAKPAEDAKMADTKGKKKTAKADPKKEAGAKDSAKTTKAAKK